jgi:hypothetical protein
VFGNLRWPDTCNLAVKACESYNPRVAATGACCEEVEMKKSRGGRGTHPAPPGAFRDVDRDLQRAVARQRYGELRGLEAVRAALAAGGDPNAVDPCDGATAVFAALGYGGWPEGVALLLEAGADPNHRDARGRTADEVVMASHSSAWEVAEARRIVELLEAARRKPRR